MEYSWNIHGISMEYSWVNALRVPSWPWLADPQFINDFPSCKHPSRAGMFQRATFDHQMVFPEILGKP